MSSRKHCDRIRCQSQQCYCVPGWHQSTPPHPSILQTCYGCQPRKLSHTSYHCPALSHTSYHCPTLSHALITVPLCSMLTTTCPTLCHTHYCLPALPHTCYHLPSLSHTHHHNQHSPKQQNISLLIFHSC